jgi:hypothetical protein
MKKNDRSRDRRDKCDMHNHSSCPISGCRSSPEGPVETGRGKEKSLKAVEICNLE